MPPPHPGQRKDGTAPAPASDTDPEVKRFKIDGVSYRVDLLGITAEMSRTYRRLTRTSVMADLSGIDDDDPASLVAMVWLARTQAGERIPVSAVDAQLGSLRQMSALDLEFDDEGAGDGDESPVDEDGELDPES